MWTTGIEMPREASGYCSMRARFENNESPTNWYTVCPHIRFEKHYVFLLFISIQHLQNKHKKETFLRPKYLKSFVLCKCFDIDVGSWWSVLEMQIWRTRSVVQVLIKTKMHGTYGMCYSKKKRRDESGRGCWYGVSSEQRN